MLIYPYILYVLCVCIGDVWNTYGIMQCTPWLTLLLWTMLASSHISILHTQIDGGDGAECVGDTHTGREGEHYTPAIHMHIKCEILRNDPTLRQVRFLPRPII